MTEKVSLYIPCLNAAQYLEETLKAVFKQTYPIDEIFVIDGGSSDNSIELASKYPLRIINQLQYDKRGLARARNIAFREAKNDFVASLNVDCIPETDWLETLMSSFTDEKIAGVGGNIKEKCAKGMANKWRAAHMSQGQGDKEIYGIKSLLGTNTVFRKSAIMSVGLYDEKLTFAEDTTISQKLRDSGYALVYNPKAFVWHAANDNLATVLSRFCGYLYYGHTKPVTWPNTIRHLRWGLRLFLTILYEDIKYKRYSLTLLDSLLPFCWCFKTIQAHFCKDDYTSIFYEPHRMRKSKANLAE